MSINPSLDRFQAQAIWEISAERTRIMRVCGCVCLLVGLLLLTVVCRADGVIDVGSRKQLFIDQKFIESSEGIRLTVNPPHQTREKLITADQPWEQDAHLGSYSTVVQEPGGKPRIRVWYQVSAGASVAGKNPPFLGVAYAESDDGLKFRKPVLRLVERNGSRENNLVLPTDPDRVMVGGGTVWRDDNPSCPLQARYKSWSKYYPRKGSGLKGEHGLWTSPDGLHWTLNEKPVTGLRAADTQPSWFWDPRVKRYAGYTREWVRSGAGIGARMVGYVESDDMLAWDSATMALELDERDRVAAPFPRIDLGGVQSRGDKVARFPDATVKAGTVGDDPVLAPTTPLDFYGPGVFPYEGVYIALVPVFYHWRGASPQSIPDTTELQLAVSRDGRHFIRPGMRRPYLSPGHDGSWDSRWIYPVLRPVRQGDELWIYYFGTNQAHNSQLDPQAKKHETAISRAVLRLDGFLSADADYEGGTFLTPPIRFAGAQLELNLDAGAGGSAKVELLEESGKPIPGFSFHDGDELTGNAVRKTVKWSGNSDLKKLAGRPVRMRFRMRSAKLYAFQFREDGVRP